MGTVLSASGITSTGGGDVEKVGVLCDFIDLAVKEIDPASRRPNDLKTDFKLSSCLVKPYWHDHKFKPIVRAADNRGVFMSHRPKCVRDIGDLDTAFRDVVHQPPENSRAVGKGRNHFCIDSLCSRMHSCPHSNAKLWNSIKNISDLGVA